MDKGKDRKAPYKLKSTTIDKKRLRVHRRSLDWKDMRNDELRKRRGVDLDDMSPVQEDENEGTDSREKGQYEGKTPTKRTSTKTGKLTVSTQQQGVNLRREQLQKWREEKELKKRIAAEKRKPTFKVYHVQHTDQAPALLTGNKTAKNTVTSTGAGRVTRSSMAPTNASKAPTNDSTSRKSRASHVRSAKDPPVKRQTRQSMAKLPASSTTTTKPERLSKTEAKSKSAKEKIPVNKKNLKSGHSKKKDELTSLREPGSPRFEIEVASSKVTKRGDDETFAPNDFTFTAPSNLSSFIFKPLSPESAASFLFPNPEGTARSPLPRRCSTPKFAGLGSARVLRTPKETTPASCIEEEDASNGKVEEKADNTPRGGRSWRRRSVRRSIRLQEKADMDSSVDNDAFPDQTAVGKVADTEEKAEDCIESVTHKPEVEKSLPRRSVHRSVRLSEGGLEVTLTENPSTSAMDSGVSSSEVTTNSITGREGMQTEAAEVGLPVEITSSRNNAAGKPEEPVESNMDSGEENGRTTNQLDDPKDVGTHPSPISCHRHRRSQARRSLVNSISSPSISNEMPKMKSDVDEDSGVFAAGDCDSQTEKEEVGMKKERLSKEHETPKRVTRSARKSMSVVEEFIQPSPHTTVLVSAKKASIRKRKSMATKIKSPEEWVKLLQQSPMIEMSRRTPKAKTPPERQPAPLAINFDDVDFILTNEVTQSSLEETDAQEEQAGSDSFIMLHSNNDQPLEKEAEQSEPPTCTSSKWIDTCDKDNKQPGEWVNEDGEHDVMYFRNLMKSQTEKLTVLCTKWEAINEFEFELSEDVKGQIRTTVGQAQLLMAQRFKQFKGLVDNCEFKDGEKETTCSDLQGFWDMVYYQVEDVQTKFADLDKLKAANWVKEEKQLPKKAKVSKKKAVSKSASKPAASKPSGKSKFAAFRAKMLTEKTEKEKENIETGPETIVKVFDAGFFKVSSPLKINPDCESTSGEKTEECTQDKPTSSNDQGAEQPASQPEATEQAPISRTAMDLPVLSTPLAQMLNRTPRRRSYVPTVPSPLLCDITPSRAKRRRSYRNTPIPTKLMRRSNGTGSPCFNRSERVEEKEDDELTTFTTPVRTARPQKSVMFLEEEANPAPDSTTDLGMDIHETVPFTVAATPPKSEKRKSVSFQQSTASPNSTSNSDIAQDVDQPICESLLKYTVPSATETPSKSEASTSEKPKSALKKSKTPLSERRRSARLNVHFEETSESEGEGADKMPQTPFNKNSLVPTARVGNNSFSLPEWDDDDADIFNKENISNSPYLDSPKGSRLGLSKSLGNGNDEVGLFTPPSRTNTTSTVKDNLMSFSP